MSPEYRKVEHMTWKNRIGAVRDWLFIIGLVAGAIMAIMTPIGALFWRAYGAEINAFMELPDKVSDIRSDVDEIRQRLPPVDVVEWYIGSGIDQSNGMCPAGEDYCEVDLVFSRTEEGENCDIVGPETIHRIIAMNNGIERRWDVQRRGSSPRNATRQRSERTLILNRPRDLPIGAQEYAVRTTYRDCGEQFEDLNVVRWSPRIPLTVE